MCFLCTTLIKSHKKCRWKQYNIFPKKHKCVIPFLVGRVWSGWWGIAAGCHDAQFDLDKWPLSGPLCFQRPPHWVLSLLGRNQSPTSCFQRCPGTRAQEACPSEHTCPNDGHLTAILDAQKLFLMEPQWKFFHSVNCVTAYNMLASQKKKEAPLSSSRYHHYCVRHLCQLANNMLCQFWLLCCGSWQHSQFYPFPLGRAETWHTSVIYSGLLLICLLFFTRMITHLSPVSGPKHM